MTLSRKKKKRAPVQPGWFKTKSVYPRICANHPAVTENLLYVYNGIPDLRSGQLLCVDCRRDNENETVETDQG